jgi:hypothetical protein
MNIIFVADDGKGSHDVELGSSAVGLAFSVLAGACAITVSLNCGTRAFDVCSWLFDILILLTLPTEGASDGRDSPRAARHRLQMAEPWGVRTVEHRHFRTQTGES